VSFQPCAASIQPPSASMTALVTPTKVGGKRAVGIRRKSDNAAAQSVKMLGASEQHTSAAPHEKAPHHPRLCCLDRCWCLLALRAAFCTHHCRCAFTLSAGHMRRRGQAFRRKGRPRVGPAAIGGCALAAARRAEMALLIQRNPALANTVTLAVQRVLPAVDRRCWKIGSMLWATISRRVFLLPWAGTRN